jgi:hypothetical protein
MLTHVHHHTAHHAASGSAGGASAAGGSDGGASGASGGTDGLRLDAAAARRAAGARLDRAKALLHTLHGDGLARLVGREDAGQQRAVYVKLWVLQVGPLLTRSVHRACKFVCGCGVAKLWWLQI